MCRPGTSSLTLLVAALLFTATCSAEEVSSDDLTLDISTTLNRAYGVGGKLTETLQLTNNGAQTLTGGQMAFYASPDSTLGFGSPVVTDPAGVPWGLRSAPLPDGQYIWFDLTGLQPGQTIAATFPVLISPSAGSAGLVTGRIETDTQGQADDINQPYAYSTRQRATAGDSPQSEVVPSDPVQSGSGEFFLPPVIDINLGGSPPLFFCRMYASRLAVEGVWQSPRLGGTNWIHNFGFKLQALTGNTQFIEVVYLGGKSISFVADSTNPGKYLLTGQQEHAYQLVNLSADLSGDFWFMDPAREVAVLFRGGADPWEASFGRVQEIHDRKGNTLTLTYDQNSLLTGVSDGKGRTLTIACDQNWNVTSVSDGTRTVAYGYDANGNLSTVTDTTGGQTTYTYDDNQDYGALLTRITRPEGNTPTKLVEYYRNAGDPDDPHNGRVTKVVDAHDNETTLSYDDPAAGRTTITDPIGTTVVTHQDMRFTTELVDRNNGVTNYEYDENGRLVRLDDSETGDARGTIRFTYHAQSGKIASVTNAEGHTITHTYTAQDQSFGSGAVTFTFYDLTRVDYPDGTHVAYTYDANGNRLTATDQAGKTTAYTYDALGRLLTQTENPAQGTATLTYNTDDTIQTSTTSATGATRYEYDALRRLTAIVENAGTADEKQVQYTYDAADRPLTITNQLGQVTEYTYDANGNLTEVKNPLNKATTYLYDDMDRLASRTDAEGNTRTYTYDALGRRLTSTDGANLTTSYGYTGNGFVNQVTHGGQTTQLGRDNEGVLTSVTTPLGRAAEFESNKLGDRTSATVHPAAGESLTTAYAYDSMRRLTTETDPRGQASTYSYDARGLLDGAGRPVIGSATYGRNADLGSLETVTDLENQNWTFAHDALGRLTGETDPLGNQTTYTYDDLGRRSLVTFPGTLGTLTYTYDDASRLTQAAYSSGPTTDYTYDAAGRLLTVNGSELGFNYDNDGRLTSTSSSGVAFASGYDGAGRLTTVGYNNGAFTVTYTRNATTGLIESIRDTLTSTQIGFTHDADRRLTAITRPNSVSTAYEWDGASRLIGKEDTGVIDVDYTYDAAGRLTRAQYNTIPLDPAAGLQHASTSITADAADQVHSAGYTYDVLGRQLTRPGNTFGWDGSADRLVDIDSGAVQMAYNGLGDLLTRDDGASNIRYHYNYAIRGTPIVAEQDVGTSQFLRYYVWSPGGRLLYMIDAANGNAVYHYHYDRNGSTLALTDSNGDVAASYSYDVDGRVLERQEGGITHLFTYAGEYGVREETGCAGLFQTGARYYDATAGQYLSRAPAWPNIRDPQSLNPYQHVGGNLPTRVDPHGRGFARR